MGSVMHSLYTLNHAYGRGSICPVDEYGYDDPQAVLPLDTWKQYVPLYILRLSTTRAYQIRCVICQLGRLPSSSPEQETVPRRDGHPDLVGRWGGRGGFRSRGEFRARYRCRTFWWLTRSRMNFRRCQCEPVSPLPFTISEFETGELISRSRFLGSKYDRSGNNDGIRRRALERKRKGLMIL